MRKLLIALMCGALVVGCGKKAEKAQTPPKEQEAAPAIKGTQMTLDHIDGLYASDSLKTGEQITFYIRLTNNTGEPIVAYSHGFTIYSPDSVTWDTVIGINPGAITKEMIDQDMFFTPVNVDGSGADTLGIGSYNVNGSGIPNGFSEVAFAVQIGALDTQFHGKHLCIDSTFYPPGGEWLWSMAHRSVHPDWDGVHCYVIVNPEKLSKASGEEK